MGSVTRAGKRGGGKSEKAFSLFSLVHPLSSVCPPLTARALLAERCLTLRPTTSDRLLVCVAAQRAEAVAPRRQSQLQTLPQTTATTMQEMMLQELAQPGRWSSSRSCRCAAAALGPASFEMSSLPTTVGRVTTPLHTQREMNRVPEHTKKWDCASCCL